MTAQESGMESRGGITGGATLSDFLSGYAQEGYVASFRVRPNAALHCSACQQVVPADRVRLMSLRRVEGVSDPADMGAVAALACPQCGARGTATFCFGTNCPPEDGQVLRALDNRRPAAHLAWGSEDQSLIRDTGWLPGPREG